MESIGKIIQSKKKIKYKKKHYVDRTPVLLKHGKVVLLWIMLRC